MKKSASKTRKMLRQRPPQKASKRQKALKVRRKRSKLKLPPQKLQAPKILTKVLPLKPTKRQRPLKVVPLLAERRRSLKRLSRSLPLLFASASDSCITHSRRRTMRSV